MGATVDTSRFEEMCSALAAEIHVPIDNIVREELGRVLSRAIEYTDAADTGKIQQHHDAAKFFLAPYSITEHAFRITGRRIHKSGRTLFNLTRHYPNDLWNEIQAARAIDLKRRLAARGLAKQSWWLMGQKLGLSVDAPGYVKKAVATTGKQYNENERVSQRVTPDEVSYTMDNSQPTVNAINGEAAMQKALDGRLSYFLENLRRGVFDNLEKIARKYSGLTG